MNWNSKPSLMPQKERVIIQHRSGAYNCCTKVGRKYIIYSTMDRTDFRMETGDGGAVTGFEIGVKAKNIKRWAKIG